MREFYINKFIYSIHEVIPQNFELSLAALNRCKKSLLSEQGLIGAELQFLLLFHPLKILKLDMFFSNAETSLKRTPSYEEKIFWRKFQKSDERKWLLKRYYNCIERINKGSTNNPN